jgi:hypothetical protein
MRDHTTDKVLKKTFEHLDKVLEEKKQEDIKKLEGHLTKPSPSENNKGKSNTGTNESHSGLDPESTSA